MLLQDVRKTVSTFITYNSLKVVLVTRRQSITRARAIVKLAIYF